MKIKLTALALMLIMVFSGGMASAKNTDYKYMMLEELEAMQGYGGGDLGLDRLVTRAEFTKMIVALSKSRDTVPAALNVSPFADVMYNQWYAPYIYVGVCDGYLAGYKDGTFKPYQDVTFEEAVTVILRMLGYQDESFGAAWPYGQIRTAQSLKISEGVSADIGTVLTREQVATLLYNMLHADAAGGIYLNTLGYTLYEDAVVIASHNENTNVRTDEIHTSAGTFKIDGGFDYGCVGKKGDLLVSGTNFEAFFAAGWSQVTYNVYSTVGSKLVLHKDGAVSNYDVDVNTTLYNGKNAVSTISASMNIFSAGDTITLHFDTNGVLQYAVYEESESSGPYTVKSSAWMSTYGIAADATIMRGGTRSSAGAIEVGDIIYYSEALSTVWAYYDKITGIYESASPNKDTPNTVTVSGKVYTIESVNAYNALSSSGSFNYGDTITLLLGKDGDVADVISPGSVQSEELIGVLIDSGTKEYIDTLGSAYTANYVKIAGIDGSEYEYTSSRNYSSLFSQQAVKVTFSGGKAVLSALSSAKDLSGTFSYSGYTLGKTSVSKNVQILEFVPASGSALFLYGKVYPQRLDGAQILSSAVAYYEKDSAGAISKLILSDATGDLYSYGLVTSASTESSGMNISGTYTYFEGNNVKTARTSGKTFTVYAGNPAKITLSASGVESMSRLDTAGVVSALASDSVTCGNQNYKLSDSVLIYLNTYDYEYQSLTLSELQNEIKSCTVTAYHDKSETSGGRIRVLVAKRK